MKLSEIPFYEIEIGQHVRSDTTDRLGSVHRTHTKRDASDDEDFFVVIHWDNGHISDNWHFWMDQITVLDEDKNASE